MPPTPVVSEEEMNLNEANEGIKRLREGNDRTRGIVIPDQLNQPIPPGPGPPPPLPIPMPTPIKP